MGRLRDTPSVENPVHSIEIICLANSNKYNGRCIAGIRADGKGWIRPVAETSHGQLYPNHYRLQDGSHPTVLDVLRIGLESHNPLPHQAENWRIADSPWKLICRPLPQRFMRVLRTSLCAGPNLFGDRSHRIAYREFEARPACRSLTLVAPTGLEWSIERKEFNPKQPRARFTLGDAYYDLPVTDPQWIDAFRELDYGLHPECACGLRAYEKLFLTISLTETFEQDGFCYKVVAGLVPIPKAWI